MTQIDEDEKFESLNWEFDKPRAKAVPLRAALFSVTAIVAAFSRLKIRRVSFRITKNHAA